MKSRTVLLIIFSLLFLQSVQASAQSTSTSMVAPGDKSIGVNVGSASFDGLRGKLVGFSWTNESRIELNLAYCLFDESSDNPSGRGFFGSISESRRLGREGFEWHLKWFAESQVNELDVFTDDGALDLVLASTFSMGVEATKNLINRKRLRLSCFTSLRSIEAKLNKADSVPFDHAPVDNTVGFGYGLKLSVKAGNLASLDFKSSVVISNEARNAVLSVEFRQLRE